MLLNCPLRCSLRKLTILYSCTRSHRSSMPCLSVSKRHVGRTCTVNALFLPSATQLQLLAHLLQCPAQPPQPCCILHRPCPRLGSREQEARTSTGRARLGVLRSSCSSSSSPPTSTTRTPSLPQTTSSRSRPSMLSRASRAASKAAPQLLKVWQGQGSPTCLPALPSGCCRECTGCETALVVAASLGQVRCSSLRLCSIFNAHSAAVSRCQAGFPTLCAQMQACPSSRRKGEALMPHHPPRLLPPWLSKPGQAPRVPSRDPQEAEGVPGALT